MEVIETKSVLPYLLCTIPIGFGTTAICFLNFNNEVLKLYYNSASTQKLFNDHDMLDHLKLLSSLSCETYNGPNKILLKDDKVIGYMYKYVYMQTLSKLPHYTTRRDITYGYWKLLKDIRRISNNHFKLFDIHHNNILFNKEYKLIDIDKGNQDLETSVEEVFIYNMRQINKTIIEEIFKLKIDEHLSFENEILQKFYIKTLYDDPYQIYDLYDRLFHNSDNIKDVKDKIKIKVYKENNDYHRSI